MNRFVPYREVFFIRNVLYQRFHCISSVLGDVATERERGRFLEKIFSVVTSLDGT